MELFIQQYGDDVTGTLSGFDRLVFRGSLRRLAYQQGMMAYLSSQRSILSMDEAAIKSILEKELKNINEALIDRPRTNAANCKALAFEIDPW